MTFLKSKLGLLCALCVVLLGVAHAQSLPSNDWGVVYTGSGTGMPINQWKTPVYSLDNNWIIVFGGNGGGENPESNTLYYMQVQSAPNANPWHKVASCGTKIGTGTETQSNRQTWVLGEALTSTTGTCVGSCGPTDRIHLCRASGGVCLGTVNGSGGDGSTNVSYQGNSTNGTGVVWIANEAIRYDKCTQTDDFNGPVCSGAGWGPNAYLWGTNLGYAAGTTQAAVRRGVRQSAGWSAPSSHSVGEAAGWDCYNPSLGDSLDWAGGVTTVTATDHTDNPGATALPDKWSAPFGRHPAQGYTYDSKRGRIWIIGGWQEGWSPTDAWSLCVKDKGGAGGGDALSVCGAADVYTATSTTKGWQRITWPTPAGYTWPQPLYWAQAYAPHEHMGTKEGSLIYDPDNDVAVMLVGLSTGSSTSLMYMFCMSATSTGFACNSGNAGTFVRLSPTTTQCSTAGYYCGNIGGRDAARMVYDPGNKKVLIFGGWGGNYGGVGFFPNNVAQFDAHTGDVCLSEGSDAAHGLYNSTRGGACSLPARSGTPPALTRMDGTSNIRLKWPAWTWVSDLSKAAYYGGEDSYEQGGIFLYDPTGNAWSKSTKGGGPTLDEAGGLSQQGWAYSESDQKFVWTSFGTSYQVQQLPLAAITGVTGTQRLSLTISGTGSATDGATFTCSTGTCTHDYNAGSRIILTATGTSGYTFAGWTGDCSGTGTCTLTMSADKSATAVFDPPAAANATKYSGMTITGVKIQ